MSESKDTGRTRTVADAVREAASQPQKGSEDSARRTPGPAKPATGSGRTPRSAGTAASSKSSTSSAENGSKATPPKAASTSSKGATQKAGSQQPGPQKTGSQKPADQKAPEQKAPEKESPAQKAPQQKSAPSRDANAATSSQQSKAATRPGPRTAGDYARSSRSDDARPADARPDDTSVMPAVATRESDERPEAPGGREAKLRLTTIEPWSVTRLAFVVSVLLMIVAVVAVAVFWVVLDLAGVWDSLNGTITNVLSDSEGSFDLTDYLGFGRLVGLTLLFGAINVVLMTAIATIAAHLYNLAAQLLGGIEVTFTDR